MKGFIKYTVVVFCAVVALVLGGCTKQGDVARQRRQKFQIVSLDKVSGSVSEGWRITMTVANNTASNMRITAANAFIKQGGRKVARFHLDGEVLLPRRRCSQVVVPLRITLANPIAALSMFNKVRKGNYSGISVDYNVSVSALASHRIFESENVSLEELAQQFNFGLKK